ncbi:YesN/AraC family two-component response regulator [Caldalkalibacillus uzonensis]|uniref:YesN/AraC family two-component response regulator n=1 Tax=Caldalkalibacillus uzonensis TaxID=353224 RepID=A0ABU0CW43_9BACI|nr:response regulator [Caldalkalibacillus uzonensis]MDQ0340559.1 YesN/AraC family two-component response regulator [Caldalkalibacillus uzonensis]
MYHVLLVEDEKLIRQGLKKTIEHVMDVFRVTWEADHGRRALEIMNSDIPDVIMTDIRMPVMNGLDFIKQAKQIYPQAPIVIISGYGDFDYAKKAMKYGVRHYLLKPVNRVELAEALQDIKKQLSEKKQNTLNPSEENRTESKIIQQIKEFIAENLSHEISLQSISEVVNLHPNYISQIFAKETGKSFSAYVTEQRIRKAKELLRNTNLKIYEIAHLVGYQSSKHFMSVFKKHTNMSPKKYRNIKISY